jgi:predicted transcriptional regulator
MDTIQPTTPGPSDRPRVRAALASFVLFLGMRNTPPAEGPRHPTRRHLEQLLEESPGLNLKDICDRLHANRGTISYHLRTMERDGRVRSLPLGRETFYFLGDEDDENVPRLAALRKGRALEIALLVDRYPGLLQKDLIEGLGTSRRLIRSQTELLQQEGLLHVRKGRNDLRHFPTRLLQRCLRMMGVGGRAEERDQPEE